MKKFFSLIASVLAGLSLLAFNSCSDLGSADNSRAVPSDNLSKSEGSNELSGKSYQNGEAILVFGNDSVELRKLSEEGSANLSARAASLESLMAFDYSYNSNDKTIELQLSKVWNTGAGQDYLAALDSADSAYKSVANEVRAELVTELSVLSALDSNGKTYGTSIKNIVLSSYDDYYSNLLKIQDDYIYNKFDSVLHFSYSLNEDGSIEKIEEIFQGDLNDASSQFRYTAENSLLTVDLNDYMALVPFAVTDNSSDSQSVLVGCPEITMSEDGNSAEMKVSLFPNLYRYGEDSSQEAIASFTEKIKSAFDFSSYINQYKQYLNTLLTGTDEEKKTAMEEFENSDLKKIFDELEKSSGTESETLSALTDGVFGSLELKASLSISGKGTGDAKLTLNAEETSLLENSSFEMDYVQLLEIDL